MTNRQLIFGLISGLIIALSGAFLAKEDVIPWLLSLSGSAMIVLNLAVWAMTRKSRNNDTANTVAPVSVQQATQVSCS